MNWPCPLKVMGSWSKIIEFQMLRKIIFILVFISPVIFCENGTERSDHIESPEMEGYEWQFGQVYVIVACILIAGLG